MFANIYQTKTGQEFSLNPQCHCNLIDFCTFSLDSCNGKVQFTAAVDVFNHILCHKGDRKGLTDTLLNFVIKGSKVLPKITDEDAKKAIILGQTRAFYRN